MDSMGVDVEKCIFRKDLEKMVNNKVIVKEKDIWSNLANFIGEMVVKYADAIDIDSLPDTDAYLQMKRVKQLYVEFYKIRNITKFRNTRISIEKDIAV